jgi:hypothetical protein
MANTNAGGKLYVCETPKPNDLTLEQFVALVWVEVKGIGQKPETGTQTNIVNYPTLDTDVTQKAKGISNAGDGELEVARIATDVGQIALRAMAATKFSYATKFVASDAPSADYVGTTYYNRGVIAGPRHPAGRNEDFQLEVFNFGNSQKEIVVNPAAQVAAVNTLKPSISGASVQTGVTLTAVVGTWIGDPTFAYQWQADDAGNGTYADISGATAATFVPVVGNVGDSLRLKVTGTSAEGTPVIAYSIGTDLQIAA